MSIQLTHNKIIELCGTVSFKRGEAFNRAQKVTFTQYNDMSYEATVAGKEDFRVKSTLQMTNFKRSAAVRHFLLHIQMPARGSSVEGNNGK